MTAWKNVKEDIRFYTALLKCISLSRAKDDRRWPRKKWILGHRGARQLAPENTLSSFRLAMEHGADGVEFDVVPSRDGIPMVIHDDTLERTTSGKGVVWHFDKAELALLDATKLMQGFAREGIPTLEQTLQELPDGALVNVELKNHGHLTKEQFVERVLVDIRPHQSRLHFLLSSFDQEVLRILRAQGVKFLLAQLLSKRDEHWHEAIRALHVVKPDALHLSPDLATPLALTLARMAHMRVALWTINYPQEAKHWLHNGIDGIFTDFVPETIAVVRGEEKAR